MKGVERYVNSKNGQVRKAKEHILSPGKNVDGYLRVTLCKNGKKNTIGVHRLVAMAFIPNPDNLPMINHKDCNPANNTVENLEWCDYQYNNTYNGRHLKAAIVNRNNHLSDIIYQFTFDGEFVKEWESMHEIERVTGLKKAGITMATRGYCHSGERVIKLYGYRGYFWLKKKDFTKERLDELIEERREHYNKEPWKDKYRNAR